MHTRLFLKFIFLSLLCLIISGCTLAPEDDKSMAASQMGNDIQSLLDVAEAARSKAAAVGAEWRDTKKFLEMAQRAVKEGNVDKAAKLAAKAEKEARDAIQQAVGNAKFLDQVSFYDAKASPQQDRKNIQRFFRDKFSGLSNQEFANGVYAMSSVLRENWKAIEEFPPYSPAIEDGTVVWEKTFANGRSYNDCFASPVIAHKYPRWDSSSGEVQTLEMAINGCRISHGEKPLKYGKNEMLVLTAYIAFRSRGQVTQVTVPDDPGALAAYQSGKKFYFSRRGQLNLACFHCHFNNAGIRIRANVLGPMLGQTSHWPAYRSKWGGMGSIHRRYKGCNKQVRAKPFAFQSKQYRNLQYFHTYISNGISLNGPGARF